jgi:MFS family permease
MRLAVTIPLLGIAQIISWGTLYYTIGVVGKPMRDALGVSEVFLFGSFTLSLLLSGLLAPSIGKMIDRRGGRLALSLGSLAAALAFVVLATATGPVMLVIGWAIAGAAMAATLYDPAFATLNQLTREHYRRAVTALTLFGGFASTVFWPLTHFLIEPLGWRGTLLVYAALHLLICLPIHALALRHAHKLVLKPAAALSASPGPSPSLTARNDTTFRWLALSFVGASFVISVVGVHMITLLTGSGLSTREAVLVGMLMGPMQVAGRLIELGFLSHVRAARVGLGAFAMLFIGVLFLLISNGMGLAAVLFVTAYGCGNGILTIIRGTAPAELIGRDALGALLGRLSRPAMIAKAVAPVAFTALLAAGLTRSVALAALALIIAVAWASFAMAGRSAISREAVVTTP